MFVNLVEKKNKKFPIIIMKFPFSGCGRQTHSLSHVRRNGGGSTGMDQAPDAVY